MCVRACVPLTCARMYCVHAYQLRGAGGVVFTAVLLEGLRHVEHGLHTVRAAVWGPALRCKSQVRGLEGGVAQTLTNRRLLPYDRTGVGRHFQCRKGSRAL
jgi:hypothetical protein